MLPMTLHDEIAHDAPHFNHVDLSNSIILFMMLSASCDTNAHGITLPKDYVAPHFNHLA